MGMRRFTRLTNGFSKKVENLAHAVSLHYMNYNFARPHATLTKAAGAKSSHPRWPQALSAASGRTATSPHYSTDAARALPPVKASHHHACTHRG